MRRVIVSLCLLVNAASAVADVDIAPTFGDPAVAGRFILFPSPDAKRVICIDDSGVVRWHRRVAHLNSYGEVDDRTFFVQDGSAVAYVNGATGAQRTVAKLPKGESIVIDPRRRLAWTVNGDPSVRKFVMRDPVTLERRWSDNRIESVCEADEQRVFVVTAERHPEKNAFSISNATLLALDRRTGRELWTHKLNDAQALEIRGAVTGRYLAIIDGLMPSNLVLLDRESGQVAHSRFSSVTDADGFFYVSATHEGELLVLETMRHDRIDRLTTLSVPELTPVKSVPLDAKENLFFFVDGGVVVTSGIYSVAAFDLATGRRLWQIEHQRLIHRPLNGAMIAALNKQDRAIVERIDVPSGNERDLYAEALPADLTEAALERKAEEANRKAEEREAKEHEHESTQRIPIGDEICLRFDDSGMLDVAEYWLLHRDGVAEYIDADKNFPPFRALGHWRKDGDTYEVFGTPLVRDVVVPDRLSVGVGVKANIDLLPDLRDAVDAYVFEHRNQPTFTREELQVLTIRRPGCPPEAQSWCSADGQERVLSVEPAYSYPEKPVDIESLDRLARAIDAYVRDLSNVDHIRFRLRGYRSYTYAEWLDPHSYWSIGTAESAQHEIDGAIAWRESSKTGAPSHDEPALFRLCQCDPLKTELARLRK